MLVLLLLLTLRRARFARAGLELGRAELGRTELSCDGDVLARYRSRVEVSWSSMSYISWVCR